MELVGVKSWLHPLIGAASPPNAAEGAELRRALDRMTRRAERAEAEVAQLEAQLASRLMPHPATVYLGGHEALVRLHTGHRLYVDTRDVGIAAHLMMAGRWESWVEAALQRVVLPGMTFCDVGAHVGYYTILGAQWVGGSGHVHSFEANPAMAPLLRKSVMLNGFAGQVTLHSMAVSDVEADLPMFFSPYFSGGGNGFGAGDPLWEPEERVVRAYRLDSVLAAVPRVDVMKLDVEGMEPQVLDGAEAIIARSPDVALVVEFLAEAVAPRMSPVVYLQQFVAKGFRLHLVRPTGISAKLTPEALLGELGGELGYVMLLRGTASAG